MDIKKSKRVLIVDDDQQVLDAIHAALESHGYEVLVAHDGNEGLVRAERDAPDLVVLDMMMPRRSGLGVLDKLHCAQGLGPRVLLVTANDDQKHRDDARTAGADAFLRKPFHMEELLSMVETLLEV